MVWNAGEETTTAPACCRGRRRVRWRASGDAALRGVLRRLARVALDGAPEEVVAVIQTFAAGAIITMLADTMVPEATEHAGRWVGLLTVLGFAAAFLLSEDAAWITGETVVLDGGLSLAGQRFELLAQLAGQIGEAIQVRLHAGELALRFFLAAAMLEHTRSLFDIRAPILRPRFKDLRKLALADDNVHLAANTGIR